MISVAAINPSLMVYSGRDELYKCQLCFMVRTEKGWGVILRMQLCVCLNDVPNDCTSREMFM